MNTQDKLKDLIEQARVDTSGDTDERILKGALGLLGEQDVNASVQKGRWPMSGSVRKPDLASSGPFSTWLHPAASTIESTSPASPSLLSKKIARSRADDEIFRRSLRRISQLSIAAVVLLVVVLGIGYLGQDSLTFAGVLEHLQQNQYAFDLSVYESEDSQETVQVRIRQPGHIRFDFSVGRCRISAIVDLDTGESLILYHAYKTANLVRTDEEFDYVGEWLFLLSARPVENLWDLKDGSETALGKRSIQGRKAQGFRLSQADERFTHDIAIWADTTTGEPVEVKIVSVPLKDPSREITWLLTHFDMQGPVDDTVFSMEMPAAYTLEGRVQLKDLEFEPKESVQARRIRESLTLCKADKLPEAVGLLLKVDWDQPIVFVERPYMFTLSEMDVVMLSDPERKTVMAEVMPMCSTVRKLCFELKRLGEEAQASGDLSRAERYFQTCVRLGQHLSRDDHSIVIVRMVGIAVRSIGLGGLEPIYEQTNQTDKLEAVQSHKRKLQDETNAIKAMRK